MRLFNRLIVAFILFTCFSYPLRARAGEPTDQLSATINEFVTILVNTPVAELRAKAYRRRR